MNRVIQTLVRTKMRAVLLGGAEFDGAKLPDSIFVTGPVPFDWLYPRMAAVGHHGGAGTVAAAFRAGVASIVVPFTAFQPFWARRVYELGTGPRPIHPQHVTVDRLAEAIRAVTTDRACAGGRRPSRRKYRPRMASQT